MAAIRPVESVRLFCGFIATDESVIGAACAECDALFGPVCVESETFPFDFTEYYREEMGTSLLRKFVAFERRIDPATLAGIKRQTNAIEERLAVPRDGRLCRRVNLDPGYLAPAKVVLATTKDFAHRICMGDGIYAEVTLNFFKGAWTANPWTYPDYRSETTTRFFVEVRNGLLGERRETARSDA